MLAWRKIIFGSCLLGVPLLVTGIPHASEIHPLFKWSRSMSQGHASAGIQPKDDEEANYRGVAFSCDESKFSVRVGPIDISRITKQPKFEQSPSMAFQIDGKQFEFGAPSLEYDEHDSIWNYVVSQPSDQGLSEAISKARRIAVSGVGLSLRLPVAGQKEIGQFGRACRSMQAKQSACELERSLAGELRLGRVTDWADASDPGVTSFILRSSKRSADGVLRSAIAVELVENRMGYSVFDAAGKDIGVMVLSEAKISNPADRNCPTLVMRFEAPNRLTILKDGQRIGVIVDEQRLLSSRRL